jgi:phage anti-repressor protein/ribosomal protein L7/L12
MVTNTDFSIEIIEQRLNNEEINSVSARDLHKALEVKKDFSSWIKYQIKKAMLVENIDYLTTHQKRGVANGGYKNILEYYLTFDSAKEISMMSGTQKGKEVRNYFIKVEKQFRLQNQNVFQVSRKEEVETQLVGLEFSFKHLRPSDASKILMTKTLFTQIGLNTSYLPEYSDEEHTYSAKALLEKFEIKISVQQFNKKMISAGFLETKTRKSSKYKTEKDVDGKEVKIPILKEFKSLTEKGLDFGKNVISPKNQLESQPHYFEKKFPELLKLLQI